MSDLNNYLPSILSNKRRGEEMKKKAQAWGFDLIVALVIFAGGIILFYLYSLNVPAKGQDILDSLSYEGNIIAESLLSEGSPSDWNETNVLSIGLIADNRINDTKLETLYNWIEGGGYNQTKLILKTKYEYFFNFSDDIEIDSETIPGLGSQPQSQDNLIKITRFTIYKDQPVTLNLYIWE